MSVQDTCMNSSHHLMKCGRNGRVQQFQQALAGEQVCVRAGSGILSPELCLHPYAKVPLILGFQGLFQIPKDRQDSESSVWKKGIPSGSRLRC